jgi:hypothetical protein
MGKSGPQMMFNLIYVSQETGESLHRIQQCNKLRARNQRNNEMKLQAGWPRIQDQCRNIRTWKDGQEPDSVIIFFLSHKLQPFAIYRRKQAQVASTSVSGSLDKKCANFFQCTENDVGFAHERYKTKQRRTRY